jgi:plasmid maintenance system antidote protein VapI
MSTMNSSKKILADNIKSLIAKEGLTVNGWSKQNKLSQKKIDRIVKEENAISLDTLDEVAIALGLMSWQLLVVDLDLSNPPKIAVTETELKLYERLRVLIKS